MRVLEEIQFFLIQWIYSKTLAKRLISGHSEKRSIERLLVLNIKQFLEPNSKLFVVQEVVVLEMKLEILLFYLIKE